LHVLFYPQNVFKNIHKISKEKSFTFTILRRKMIYHICQYFMNWFVLETENEKSYTFSFINNGIIEFIAFVIHFMFSMMHYSNYIVKNAQLYIYHNNLHSLFDETNIYIWKKNICIFSKSFCYYCSMNIQNYKRMYSLIFWFPTQV